VPLYWREPGYRHILIEPVTPEQLNSAKASLQTLYGEVRVQWKRTAGKFAMQVLVPPNARATLQLPGEYVSGDIDAEMIAGHRDGRTTIELPAGSYKLASKLAAAAAK
jgi:hypothetical protein